MRTLNLNAIYVKMVVEPQELSQFFPLAQKLGFRGLSVTMPLKEHVIPFLDHIDPTAKSMGAVNTLLLKKGKISGYNTDDKGALDAIEKHLPVKNKTIVILGAGGVARAIIYEAQQRGAEIHILNRTPEKALHLAQEFSVKGGALEDVDHIPYDILINTTPLVLTPKPHTLVMDITTSPKMTPFLMAAAAQNCSLVYGYEMFVNQAAAQFNLWFNEPATDNLLECEVLKHL